MSRWTVEDLRRTEWFEPLMQQVQQELDRLSGELIDQRPALEHAHKELDAQVRGWRQSLGNPDLNPAVRAVVEADFQQAMAQKSELERQLAEQDAAREQARKVVDPQRLVDNLNRLPEILDAGNPTRGNMELSLYIDSIRCYHGGRVVMRTCKLGVMADAIELVATLSGAEQLEPPDEPGVARATPRRRARLRVESRDAQGNDLRSAALAAADVHRFAGLDPDWFWEDIFEIPPKSCWASDNAAAVAAKKVETGWTLAKLEVFFGKSKPTIAKALRIAAEQAAATDDNDSKCA